MRNRLATTLLALTALAALPGTARGQGALVSGSVAAAAANSNTAPAYGGGVTWRFNRVLGLGVELSHIAGLGPAQDLTIFCCGGGTTTRMTVFTTNVRIEIPTLTPRVIPFVVGGGGTAAGTTRYPVMYAQVANTVALPSGVVPPLPILPGPSWVESSGSNMALTLGGGASFLMTRHLSLDLDLRVLHVMGDNGGGDVGRFGGGVSYRF